MVGLLGILKVGGAYVPLDPAYPEERLRFLAEDAGLSVLLTKEKLIAERRKTTDGDPPSSILEPRLRGVCLDRDWHLIAQKSDSNPKLGIPSNNLAYVIYTSGSTGRPKGVLITHHGLSNRLLWMQDTYRLTESDHVLHKTPISFDVSVWEI